MYKRFTAKNQHFPQILQTFLILFVKFVAFCKLVLGNCFVKQTNNLIELSPSLTCFARSGGTPKLERTLIQCVLIRGMCQLRVRAARRRENGAPSLTDSTSDCAVWVRSWRTKRSDTAFSRFVLPTARLPFVACNELAIDTKSIASVLPHAERTSWVPSNLCRGRTAVGETREEGGSCI